MSDRGGLKARHSHIVHTPKLSSFRDCLRLLLLPLPRLLPLLLLLLLLQPPRLPRLPPPRAPRPPFMSRRTVPSRAVTLGHAAAAWRRRCTKRPWWKLRPATS
jgi:hypothetical protein